MEKRTHEPGPHRSTSEAAFTELRNEVAARNELAHRAALKLRVARDARRNLVRRQQEDRLD